MATPPRPSSAEVDAALARIAARHDRADDPRRSEQGSEPRDVLEYLRRRWVSTPRLAQDDIWDELVLAAAEHWESLARHRALLRRARHLGLSLAELGAHLGIGSRQGVQDYLDRLEARLESGVPDKELTRHARRQAKAHPTNQRWLDEHREHIAGLVDRLLAQSTRVLPPVGVPGHREGNDDGTEDSADEAASATHDAWEWLEELQADRDAGLLTPATMSLLGLALGELRVHPSVRELDPAHGLHRVLRQAEMLRATYAQQRE